MLQGIQNPSCFSQFRRTCSTDSALLSGLWVLSVIAFLVLPSTSVHAWGEQGHKVVCDIAWRELLSDVRQEVRRLIRQDPDYGTFAESCVWPDAIRAQRRCDWAKSYHYVNLPEGARAVSLQRDCQPKGCVLAGIYRYNGLLGDTSASDADRLMALKFLGHFVGDVHQPLHVSRAEDKGGSDIEVRFRGRSSNLHKVWDTGMLAERSNDWRSHGQTLHASITDADRAAWKGGGVIEWTNESWTRTMAPDTRYRMASEDVTLILSQDYLDQNYSVLEQRLKQAGMRLGMLLNQAISPTE